MSKITTHILDTARGCPAEGVKVMLAREEVDIASGITNKDGRIAGWLDCLTGEAWEAEVPGGIYKIRFVTQPYFGRQSVPAFYPFVDIFFEIGADSHYHIPLLISPFGYSTYRGS